MTCEHGGNHVPRPYLPWFAGHGALLASHRGWDRGALAVADQLAQRTGAPLIRATTTRLLVDLNRSARNPRVFSEITRGRPREERERLLTELHAPHRAAVRAAVETLLGRQGRVLHVAVHSFTPILDGERRRADLGLLYDPRRAVERELAQAWRVALQRLAGGLRVRRNYPYLGRSDGLTTALRRLYPAARYAGFELELNQALLRTHTPARLAEIVARSLEAVATVEAATAPGP